MSNNSTVANNRIVRTLRSMLKKKGIGERVRYVPYYPYTVRASINDRRPNYHNYQNTPEFDLYDTVFIVQDNETKKIIYLYPRFSLDVDKPCKRMYKHYENVMLPKMKENEKPTDSYKIIGVDCEFARDEFMLYGDQFTVLFEMEDIECHHPYNVYPYSMSVKEIGKKEIDREQKTEDYWKPHNITGENLGYYPAINLTDSRIVL